MSIKCQYCNHKMSTFEFIGNITAELFLLLKNEGQKSKGVKESWSQFMAGFSNKTKIPCTVCKKTECWLPED